MLAHCFAIFLLLQTTSTPGVQPGHVQADTVDAAVYAAALNSLVAPDTLVIVLDSVLPVDRLAPILWHPQTAPGADSLMIQRLLERSKSSGTLPRTLPLLREVHLVRAQDLRFGEGLNPTEWWEAFYRRHPGSGGTVRFSGIGYNQDQTRAILYVEHRRGGRWGTGDILFLSRTAEGWQVEDDLGVWVS